MVLDETKYGTTWEKMMISGFMVNIMDIISLKAQLSKAFSIQPSEVDKMPFWEFELFLKELERLVKEENERNKDEMDKAGVKDAMKMTKPGAMDKMMSSSMKHMPKMPDMSKMSMPTTIKMPSYKM